jgi:hypothetical protein
MDNKDLINDEIEILDDIVEEEILFKEEEPTYKTTYTEDNSLQDSSNVSLGGDVEGHSLNEALTKFNTDDNPIIKELPQEEVKEVKEEFKFEVESPTLSDELDQTLIVAKNAIDPSPVIEDNIKDETKSNKRAIIFIIVLFAILAVFILAFPFIKDFITNLK